MQFALLSWRSQTEPCVCQSAGARILGVRREGISTAAFLGFRDNLYPLGSYKGDKCAIPLLWRVQQGICTKIIPFNSPANPWPSYHNPISDSIFTHHSSLCEPLCKRLLPHFVKIKGQSFKAFLINYDFIQLFLEEAYVQVKPHSEVQVDTYLRVPNQPRALFLGEIELRPAPSSWMPSHISEVSWSQSWPKKHERHSK